MKMRRSVRFVLEHTGAGGRIQSGFFGKTLYAAPAAAGSGAAAAASGYTLINLPCRPLSSNLTTPLTRAKSVSSFPRPTFLPGFHLVPRWRASMLPPSTRSPPNFFNPNLCEFESRPLREEPTPFLCAIVLTPKQSRESGVWSLESKAFLLLTPDSRLTTNR